MKSKCCNNVVEIIDSGEFVEDIARIWAELECQECGSVYFEDEPQEN
jgi:hypothetical protein